MNRKNSTENHDKMLSAGARLKELRESAKLTQAQLADLIDSLPENTRPGRSEKQISYIENGSRSISADYARLLAKIFKIKPEYLLMETNFKTDEEEREHSNSSGKSIEPIIKALGYKLDRPSKRRFTRMLVDDKIIAWEDFPEIVNDRRDTLPIYERELIAPDGRKITIYTDEIIEMVSDIMDYAKWKFDRKFNETHRYKYPEDMNPILPEE